ncbi:universal stress protein [Aeromicrobium sp. NPDC092404]|uniref:universal stress protein n=1 Tax=Aeromicrobium sp. NPDC092404 TaxID=3154976 RepID=UPI003429E06A
MTSSSRTVVVGVIDKQPTALRFAMREATRLGARLEVVHSASLPAQGPELYLGVDVFADVRAAGHQVLDDAKSFIEQEVAAPVADYVLSTAPAVETLERVSAGAELMVVGADDLPWYDRMLGGGVVRHLVKHAACPVVVVPEIAYPRAPRGGVVVTLDGDTSAAGPLRYAFEQADAHGHELHVLHATPPATLPRDVDAIRANVSEVLAGWSEAFPHVRVLPAFVFDGAGDAIVAATTHAELVVIGRPRSRAVPFALARPLSVQVLKQAACPVAIVAASYRGI